MNPIRDRTSWLLGGNARCRQGPALVGRPWRLVLLGPPGSGKGTQARLLSTALGACPLSTGDLFRVARNQSVKPDSLLAVAREYMGRGELVPDRIMLDLLWERTHCLHCAGGFLLDGFPRTLPQARALTQYLGEQQLPLDAVLFYDVDAEVLITRLAGRRVCTRCRGVFHRVMRPPRIDGVCDFCEGTLEQRGDDRPEAVRVRLQAYAETTLPLLTYYRDRKLLIAIPAADEPANVLSRTLDALAELTPSSWLRVSE